jgi:hypothetical protein
VVVVVGIWYGVWSVVDSGGDRGSRYRRAAGGLHLSSSSRSGGLLISRHNSTVGRIFWSDSDDSDLLRIFRMRCRIRMLSAR